MYKIVRVICALILSALMMTPVHAEGSDVIEFELTKEIVDHDTTARASFNGELLTNLIVSDLEPNKEYQVDIGSTSGPYTTDNNGTLTVHLYGVNPGKPQHVTIKGVSKLKYSIDYAQFIHPNTRHQSDIDMYHDGTLVGTTVGKRNQGVKTGTYTANAGSKEKIVLRDNVYKAFETAIMGGVDGVGDPNQHFNIQCILQA